MTNGIIDILTSDSLIQNAVGLDKDGDTYKVYPIICPQPEQHPYIVVRINSQEPIECMDGPASDSTFNFSVYCFGNSYEKISSMSDSVKIVLDRYNGTNDGVQFEEIRFVTLRDEGVDVGGTILYSRVLTFDAHVYESPAT
jgi:hypothetical protein